MNEKKELTINMNEMSSFFEWFFITSINNTESEFINKILDNSVLNEKGEIDGTHRIKMFINDIEVEPLTAIHELQTQFDRIVSEKASEKLIQTFSIEDFDQLLLKYKEIVLSKIKN
jgi:hypothetical protein